jgi:hypothetical protein
MDKKIKGAWIINHSQKLRGVVRPPGEYELIDFAGKCGLLLNALAGTQEINVDSTRLLTLAKANGISSRLELPPILDELQKQRLIDRTATGVAVLGLTTRETLEHTATVFEAAGPQENEIAALELAEKTSDLPMLRDTAAEYVSDTLHIASKETSEIIDQCEEIGFVDTETVGETRLLFNGNLFRHEEATKIKNVLSSLSSSDERQVASFSEKLQKNGCILKSEAVTFLGDALYSKLHAIGFIDENTIGNERGMFTFVTKPSAFSKFTDSIADDAFDLAKALVTSLTYGMTTSPAGRGRITMIDALMRKLINGYWVGPATAIGQDYKVLELRGVIEVRPTPDGLFLMRLLKKDVGELALRVITEGEASSTSLLNLPSVSATRYDGPEKNRVISRKKQSAPLKKGVARLLDDLRTGGLR